MQSIGGGAGPGFGSLVLNRLREETMSGLTTCLRFPGRSSFMINQLISIEYFRPIKC